MNNPEIRGKLRGNQELTIQRHGNIEGQLRMNNPETRRKLRGNQE
jgi:hypothetical protein